tara:strand:- start:219 stop:2456 length:2238 start_codon:yes stop_codon:yes gene_type:complete
MVERTEQIVREAPDIEAYKIGLLKSAKALSDKGVEIPPQMVAEMSSLQIQAGELAQAGIGGYQPFLTEAGYTLGDAQTAIGGAVAGSAPLFDEASNFMRQGANAIPGQISAAQQGITNAIGAGQSATDTSTLGLGTAADNARLAAGQSTADQLAAYDAIPGQISAAQQGMTGAAGMAGQVADASRYGGTNVQNTLAGQLGQSTDQARTYGALGGSALNAAQQASAGGLGAYERAMGGIDDVSTLARNVAGQARTGGQTAAQQAAAQTQSAITGARDITSDAAQALQQAGALGTQTAQSGIAALGGTTGAFNPNSTGAFMNQYEDAAVQQALSDIQRQGNIAAQGQRAQAVGAGAFGGSRQGVQEAEMARNVLEQQGRTAAGMRQQGFESASQRAQQAFESQQARGQQAAQITGALGSQGASAGIQAAQSAGQLGLSTEELAARTAQQQGQLGLSAEQLAATTGMSAEQLAQQGATQGGQLGLSAYNQSGQLGLQGTQAAASIGMSAEQMASANAQALAQTGMSLQQLSAQTGMNAAQLAGQMAGQQGQLGLQGAQAQAGIAAQAGQTTLAGEQFAGQMAGQQGQLGQAQANMGMQGAQAAGGLGLQGSELQGRLGEGLGGLGAQQGQMALAQGEALSNLGIKQASLGELGQNMGQKQTGFLFDIGKQYQAQNQAELEAKRQTELQQAYEPYQRVSFLSDIYKGAPSSQQSLSATTAPSVSPAQSILGLGVAGLSAYAGGKQAGLF